MDRNISLLVLLVLRHLGMLASREGTGRLETVGCRCKANTARTPNVTPYMQLTLGIPRQRDFRRLESWARQSPYYGYKYNGSEVR